MKFKTTLTSLISLLLFATTTYSATAKSRSDCELIPNETVRTKCYDTVAAGKSYYWFSNDPRVINQTKLGTRKRVAISLLIKQPKTSTESSNEIFIRSFGDMGWVYEKSDKFSIQFAREAIGAIGGLIISDVVSSLIGGKTGDELRGPYYYRVKIATVQTSDTAISYVNMSVIANYGSSKEMIFQQADPKSLSGLFSKMKQYAPSSIIKIYETNLDAGETIEKQELNPAGTEEQQ